LKPLERKKSEKKVEKFVKAQKLQQPLEGRFRNFGTFQISFSDFLLLRHIGENSRKK
jgi:hypothetical protein